MTTDDLIGKPHLVIMQSDTELKVVTFTGPDADQKAHQLAFDKSMADFPGCITVAVRIRQLCPFKYERLMS